MQSPKIAIGTIVTSLYLFSAPTSLQALDLHNFEPTPLQKTLTDKKNTPIFYQIDDDFFVDGIYSQDFSWETYLSNNAPHLLSKANVLSHWAGIASINPKLVIALMELNSGIITNQNHDLESPLSTDKNIKNFDENIAQTLMSLSHYFYQNQQRRNRSQHGQLNTTAATLTLTDFMFDRTKTTNNNEHLQTLFTVYEMLFPGEVTDLLLHNKKDETNKTSSTPPKNLLQLPWRQTYSWISNGAHSTTGSGYPLSSIDVSYNWPRWGARTYSVTAAHSGEVTVYSRCNVRIRDPESEWETNYYHMEDLTVSTGDWVDINTRIGTYANDRNTALCEGGSSTGPHLHFSLLYKGAYKSLQNVNLGPYIINVGNYNYDSNCNRFWFFHSSENRKYCAWSRIYNPGPLK